MARLEARLWPTRARTIALRVADARQHDPGQLGDPREGVVLVNRHVAAVADGQQGVVADCVEQKICRQKACGHKALESVHPCVHFRTARQHGQAMTEHDCRPFTG